MEMLDAVKQNFPVVVKEWLPYISWAVVPAIIGTVKKLKPSLKDSLKDYWPIVAVIIAMLLNTVGIKINPKDLDLPETKPPVAIMRPMTVESQKPAQPGVVVVEPSETGSTGRIAMYAPETPSPVPVEPKKKESALPLALKIAGLSLMGGLAASKAHDLRKDYQAKKAKRESEGGNVA